MKKFLLMALLLMSSPLFGQTTTGYHRMNQVTARATGGSNLVVQPFAKVYVTSTATSTVATIYSDPLLSITITGATITADVNGNYSYYIPLNYCVNERVDYPGSGSVTTTNICLNSVGSSVSPSQIVPGTEGQFLSTVSGVTDWRTLIYPDITNLWDGGSCVGYLNSDGTCSQPTNFQHNGINLPLQHLLNFLDVTPSLPATGSANIFLNDGAGGLGSYTPYATSSTKGTSQPDNTTITVNDGVYSAVVSGAFTTQIVPPLSTQYVVIYPTGVTSSTGCGTGSAIGYLTSGIINYVYGGSGACGYRIDWTFTGSLAAQAPWVVPANVTSVQFFAIDSAVPRVSSNQGAPGVGCTNGTGYDLYPNPSYAWASQQFTKTTSVTGATVDSTTCEASVSGSVIGAKDTTLTVSKIGAFVFYTGTPPPANTAFECVAPFYCDTDTLTMGVSLPLDIANDTGSTNVLVANVAGYTGLIAGETINVFAKNSTTSATPTFNLNGYGAKTIVGPTGKGLASGDIVINGVAVLKYDTGNWYLQNPQKSQPTSGTGPSQTIVTSSSTIAPTARFFLVSGSATISTITAPAFCVVSGTMCQITMIPDGTSAWSTTTGGNIALGSTAVPLKALVMTYDPATALWYPSY